MRILTAILVFTACCLAGSAQSIIRPRPAGYPEIKIVDSLTQQELLSRRPVILQSELDSLIQLWVSNQPVAENKVIPSVQNDQFQWLLVVLLVLVGAACIGIYMVYRNGKRVAKLFSSTSPPVAESKTEVNNETNAHVPLPKRAQKNGLAKTADMQAEIERLTTDNKKLKKIVTGYNGIQGEYDSLQKAISTSFKISNYPGGKDHANSYKAMEEVLRVEKALAREAYHRYVRKLHKLADENKNAPARMSEDDSARMIELLISLSLLYIEQLYLRVEELSLGGKITARMHQLGEGKPVDITSLRQLDKERGSRALVLRTVLDRYGIKDLAYPVFDETNLNLE